jgi:hypothetical protein
MSVIIRDLQIFKSVCNNLEFPEDFYEGPLRCSSFSKRCINAFYQKENGIIKENHFFSDRKVFNSSLKLIGVICNINNMIPQHLQLLNTYNSEFFVYLEDSISKTFSNNLYKYYNISSISISDDYLFKFLILNIVNLNVVDTFDLKNIVFYNLIKNNTKIDMDNLIEIQVLNEANSN